MGTEIWEQEAAGKEQVWHAGVLGMRVETLILPPVLGWEEALTARLREGEPLKNSRGVTDMMGAAFPSKIASAAMCKCSGGGPDWRPGSQPPESYPGEK